MNSCHKFAVRPMQEDDIEQVVEIHLQSFPNFFLTFLGSKFLSLLYKGIFDDPGGIIIIGSDGQKIQGFVAGVTNQAGFYRRLIRKQKWAFAWASLDAVLRRPAIVPRLWRALRRPSDTADLSAEACLMSIAVLPQFQGQGIGRRLVEVFCQELAARKKTAVCLTTDHDYNEAANHFYQRLGFNLTRSFITPEGRAMNEYIRYLREE